MLQDSKKQELNFDNVRALLAEPRTHLREDFIRSLSDLGLTDIESTGNLHKVHECLAEGGLDLLICGTILPEGDLHDLIKSVRFGETSTNPFLVIVTLVSNPTAEVLHKMMDCGPDAILIKPFSPEQLNERITSLVHNRKRFAVTSDYVGPERRKGDREDKTGKETIRVPNPLYIKSFGIENLAVTRRAADTATMRINNQMVESYSQRATDLVEELFPPDGQITWTPERQIPLNELHKVTFELNKRISGTDYKPLAGLTSTLIRMLKDAGTWTEKTNKGDIRLLRILCEVLQRGFNYTDDPLLPPPVIEGEPIEASEITDEPENPENNAENVLELSSSG